MAAKTIPVKKFLGIRNTTRPEAQPWGALRDAVNVTIDDHHVIEQREGHEIVKMLTDATDLWAPVGVDGLYSVVNGALISYSDTLVASTVTSGLSDCVFSWDELGDRVFYAGLVDAGIIVERVYWQPLRIPLPDFSVYAAPGTTPAGQYQVTATYTHTATGVEGPAAAVETIGLADGETLAVDVLPLAGLTANVYVSECNGSIPYCNGVPLSYEQRDASSFPLNVTAITAQSGTLYASVHDAEYDLGFVFWSEPFWFTCWHLATNYVSVPGKVVQMAETAGGILILTTHSVWLWNGEVLQNLADYGSVPGCPMAQDREGLTAFWTERGVCLFGPDGFRNITQDHVAMPPGTFCISAIFERKGAKYFIANTDGGGVLANAYEAVDGTTWVTNLRTGETTRWTWPDVKGLAVMNHHAYLLTETRLLRMGGATDAAADPDDDPLPIPASITLHPTDFGDSTLKRCTTAYLTGCDEVSLTVTPTCDETSVGSYSAPRRIPLARGVKGHYWQFKVQNASGGVFRLTGLEILVEPTSRRV